MASPLKITLKLSAPKIVGSPQSSTSTSNKTIRDEETVSIESPRKRAKPNARIRKQPRVEETLIPETNFTADEDLSSIAVDEASYGSNKRGGNNSSNQPSSNTSGNTQSNTISKKDLLKHKDVKVRQWTTTPLVFYTLDGSEIQISNWQSHQKMTINESTTEPITVAEIDQLFSSTAGEKDFRPFLCTQPGCSKAFTTFDQLQTHETNMHGTKKLVCGIDGCHKSFVTPGQLTKHRKMVHFRAARKAKMAAAAAAEAEVEASATAVDISGENSEDVNKEENVANTSTASAGIAGEDTDDNQD